MYELIEIGDLTYFESIELSLQKLKPFIPIIVSDTMVSLEFTILNSPEVCSITDELIYNDVLCKLKAKTGANLL